MNNFEIRIEKVNEHCSCGYEVGNTFICKGLNTPNDFCGGAYTTAFPIIVALNSGAQFGFEKDPLCKTGMACPDKGKVIMSIKKIS